MASLVLSLATTVGLTTWMAGNAGPVLASSGGGVVGASATTAPAPVTVVPPVQTTVQAQQGLVPEVTPTAPTTTATATNTVVNGDAFRNRFGSVQVQATFSPDGSLADVTVLQAPSGDRRSAQISNVAIPRLNNEALTAQSAHVDTISGATYTSRGYESSLQSAIDIARANAITNIG